MTRGKYLRRGLGTLLYGSLLLNLGCGDLVSQSIKEGVMLYISGSVSNSFGSAQIGDFVFNLLTGSQTGLPD